MNKKMDKILSLLFIAGFILGACSASPVAQLNSSSTKTASETNLESSTENNADADAIVRPDGWEEASHGKDVEPNYEIVFPDDRVNKLIITISPDDWKLMQDDMVDLFGEPGNGGNRPGLADDGEGAPQNRGQQPGGAFPPANLQPGENGEIPHGFPEGMDGAQPIFPEDAMQNPPQDGNPDFGNLPRDRGLPGGANGRGILTPENPTWVSATIAFNGEIWTHVGVRYKGNSSLTSGWNQGTTKLPFKLDFDEFEDDYEEITDQRFYGFKQLSLANGFTDNSFMRDAAMSNVLEAAGLPAAETTFVEVMLDHGEGQTSLGLYTMIEVVDDTVISRYFGSDDGNIYEAEGTAATFSESSYNQIETSFLKENNTDEADWSDIENLFTILHADTRTTEPDLWREHLESAFDVDGFLEWLAIASVTGHWDAYGNMSHNYYLYHDPDGGQLAWISWDHNQSMSSISANENDRGRGGMNRTVSLDKNEINDDWPLIRFLLDDPVYYEKYIRFLSETISGAFEPSKMEEMYLEMKNLIEPFAIQDVGKTNFENAVQELIAHAYARAQTVETFLTSIG